LIRSLQNEWPENYFNLFGAIKDDSFEPPEEIDHINIIPREKL
jgi:hypothetical protein